MMTQYDVDFQIIEGVENQEPDCAYDLRGRPEK